MWSSRIQLEARTHEFNSFVTLTYSDENLPLRRGPGVEGYGPTLDPVDLKNFMKRLRVSIPYQIRFFGVGEYGEKTFRPHYHVGLFGFPPCVRGQTLTAGRSERRVAARCCPQCKLVADRWGFGDIEVRNLDKSKCGYLANYTVKKMTKKEDARLRGRHPEFSRQSNQNGGIGYGGLVEIEKTIRQHVNLSDIYDVPTHLNNGKEQLVLGRYLRRKLRERLGGSGDTPPLALYEFKQKQMLEVHAFKKAHPEVVSDREAFALMNEDYDLRLKFRESLKKGDPL